MSINNTIGNLQQIVSSLATSDTKSTQQTQATQNATGSPISSATTATKPDQANLSSAAGLIAQALDTSDVRTEKVAALQQAINSGTYNVSSSDVAGKMIDSLTK